jgi:adenine-specific DNA-methyltransferase
MRAWLGGDHRTALGQLLAVSEEELRRLDADGRIYWGVDGNSRPYLKRFLSEVASGRVPSSVWHPEEVGFVRNGKEEVRGLVGEVFATPKPERLLGRVVHIGSDPGDIVLDCYAGSGTTPAVAHKMVRRWIAVEMSADTIDGFVRPRLEKVVKGADPGGITEAVGWEGGGGFRYLEVGPSMFEDLEGTTVLSDWAVGGALAEAVAAQLGFTVDADGPFVGRKGRACLAVLDGMLTAGVADHLLTHLDDRETLTVVARALEPGVEDHIRASRPGSRARKVPRDLAHIGVLSSRLVRLDAHPAEGAQ